MTVSRVINEKEHIAPETRKRVKEVLKRLRYSPNINARTLVTRKTEFLGLLVPDIGNPFFADLVKAAESVARQRGYSLILGDAGGDADSELEYFDALRGRMCDAIVLVAPRSKDEVIAEFSREIPIVLVDRSHSDDRIIQVALDNREGARAVVDHLVGLGHRRIGFIMGPENVPNARLRREGFQERLRHYGIVPDPALSYQGEFERSTGAAAFRAFFGQPDPPTAVFASNDLMAYGLIQEGRRRGISIPKDLSVVGFDDIFLSALMDPPLTTVRYPIVEMGVAAIEKLLISLGTDSAPPEPSVGELHHELIVRGSTVPLKKERE